MNQREEQYDILALHQIFILAVLFAEISQALLKLPIPCLVTYEKERKENDCLWYQISGKSSWQLYCVGRVSWVGNSLFCAASSQSDTRIWYQNF